MADYASILNKAIAGLQENNASSRVNIYGKARSAIERQLRGMTPAPSQAAIDRQLQMLEAAIAEVEAEQAAADALSIPDPAVTPALSAPAENPVVSEAPVQPEPEPVPAPPPPAAEPPAPPRASPQDAGVPLPLALAEPQRRTASEVPPAPPEPPAPPVTAASTTAGPVEAAQESARPVEEPEPPESIESEWMLPEEPKFAETSHGQTGGLPEEGNSSSLREPESLADVLDEPLAPAEDPAVPSMEMPPQPAEPLKGPVGENQPPQAPASEPGYSAQVDHQPVEPSGVEYEPPVYSEDDAFDELADAINAGAEGWEARVSPDAGMPPQINVPQGGAGAEEEYTADAFADAFDQLAHDRDDALNPTASRTGDDLRVEVPEPVLDTPLMPEPARQESPVRQAATAPFGAPVTPRPLPQADTPQPPQPQMPPPGPMHGGPAVPPSGPGIEGFPPAARRPLPQQEKKGGAGKILAGILLLALLGGGAYAGWMNREKLTEIVNGLTGKQGEEVAAQQESAPAEPPADTASEEIGKNTERLGSSEDAPAPDAEAPMEPETSIPDGQSSGMEEKSVGEMGADTVGEQPQDSQSAVTVEPDPATAEPEPLAEPDSTTEEPPVQEDTASDGATATDAQNSADQAVQEPQQALPAGGQTAYLYEEGGGDGGASRDEARVAWSIDERSPEDGMPPEPVIKGALEVPGRGLNLEIIIRRNVDQALSASHIIELNFTVLPEFSGGGIDDVSRFVMKANESARGQSLVGVPVKIDNGYFLIALNNLEQAKQANETLMESSDWIDIPIRYVSGRRALLALEKGSSGKEVFDKALADWKNR